MLRIIRAGRGRRAAPHSQYSLFTPAHSSIPSATSVAYSVGSTSTCAVNAVPSSVCIINPYPRFLHSSSSLYIVGRARSKKILERSAAEEAEAAAAEEKKSKQSKLKILLQERADKEAAEAAALLSQQYRKPKIKKRGRTFEENQLLLNEMDEKQSQMEEMELQAIREKEEKEAQIAAAKAEESGTATRKPFFPLDLSLSSEAASAAAAAAPTPTPLLHNVEQQLRALDNASARHHNVGGLGFDSIRLESMEVLPSEVFEEEIEQSGSMKKLSQDRDRRNQFKRIEKVTEKSREIIGRVLMEESIKIGIGQESFALQQSAYESAMEQAAAGKSLRPRKLKIPAIMQLLDIRRVAPCFSIHDVRYSTDLAWLQIRYTLNKEYSHFAEEISILNIGEDANNKKTRSKKHETESATAASELSESTSSTSTIPDVGSAIAATDDVTPLPSWSVCKRQLSTTLDHILPTLRYTLGRELNLRYTPSIRFVYDEKKDIQEEKLKKMDLVAQRDEELLTLAFSDSPPVTTDAASSTSAKISSLANAKSSLLGLSSPSELDIDRFEELMNDPVSRELDIQMEKEFNENKINKLPKYKLKQIAARTEEKRKREESIRKKKALVTEAHHLIHGIPTRGIQTYEEDPYSALDAAYNGSSHPTQIRQQLQATMSKLLSTSKNKRDFKKIVATKTSISMLGQLQSLKRKIDINPVAELKKKLKKDSVKQFPDNWKQLTNQFYKR
jgi:hypothetical protein